MSILKFLIIRNDGKRLLTAFVISMLVFSPALINISLVSTSQPKFGFQDKKNSLFQKKSPNTLGDTNPERVEKVISVPNLLTQRSSKVQIFTKANTTKEKITPDPVETVETINEVTSNLSQEQSTESKQVTGAISTPVLKRDFILSPAPNYPLEARKQSIEGEVGLKLTITPAGIVDNVEILRSSGFTVLDQEAVSTLYNWIYQTDRSKQINRDYQITIKFTLDDLEIPVFRQNITAGEVLADNPP